MTGVASSGVIGVIGVAGLAPDLNTFKVSSTNSDLPFLFLLRGGGGFNAQCCGRSGSFARKTTSRHLLQSSDSSYICCEHLIQ